MGYTGAVYKDFFSSSMGMLYTIGIMLMWITLPLVLSVRSFNKKDLDGNEIWIEDHGIQYPADDIIKAPRIGVAYAQEDALLPWRFFVKGNKYVSKPNTI